VNNERELTRVELALPKLRTKDFNGMPLQKTSASMSRIIAQEVTRRTCSFDEIS
jgi:hypothetical protein